MSDQDKSIFEILFSTFINIFSKEINLFIVIDLKQHHYLSVGFLALSCLQVYRVHLVFSVCTISLLMNEDITNECKMLKE